MQSGGQVKLASVASLVITSNQKHSQTLRPQDKQNNELKAWINLKFIHYTLLANYGTTYKTWYQILNKTKNTNFLRLVCFFQSSISPILVRVSSFCYSLFNNQTASLRFLSADSWRGAKPGANYQRRQKPRASHLIVLAYLSDRSLKRKNTFIS